MSLISIVISLIVVGVLLWLVNTYIPMDGKIKKILNIVVVVVVRGAPKPSVTWEGDTLCQKVCYPMAL